MHDAPINRRALPQQRDLIDYAAIPPGISRSKFMLEAASQHAQTVVPDHTFFGIDSKRFKQFTEFLDAPKVANAGFARLMDVKTPWNENSD